MIRQLDKADATAAAGSALGVLAAFLPWYGYAEGASRVSVNGFRASLLGDLFFLAVVATILLLLIGRGVIEDFVTAHVREVNAYAYVSAIAVGSVMIQLIVARDFNRSLGAGLFLGLVAALALCAAAALRRLDVERRRTVREMISQEGSPTP